MNEELKIIISAEIDKLKRNVDAAKKEITSFKEQVSKASADVDSKFKKLGDGIGNAIKTGCKAAATAAAGVTTAIAGLVTSSVKNFAEYEQLVGGVEKLFGDSAGKVQKYAEDAYKSAGIGANEYMTQVTSFSASLISSLGGDTAKAADYANMAVTDMADNVNVFGSNMEDVQNAYQGFAKQNYTMLDNLKLGYGGTKEEMQRLIDDANKLKEAQGEVGDLTIEKYSDVIEAIHLVQDEMNITGTTAKEAEGTISGSIEMTKAAWNNLVTGLADSNANIPQLVNNVVSSATSVLKNIIPVAKQVLESLPAAISEISPQAGAAFQVIVDTITTVLDNLKPILETTFDIIMKTITFVGEHTALIATIAGIIGGITAAIGLYNAVAAVKAAMDAAQVTTLGALISAYLAQAAAMAVAIAPYVAIVAAIAAVIAIIVTCIKHWDDIKEAVGKAWDWIKQKTSSTVDAVVGFFKKLWESVKNSVKSGVDTVKKFFTDLWKSIKDIWDDICNVIEVAILLIKSIFQAAIQMLLIPWNLLWKNFGDEITEAWNKFKKIISDALNVIKQNISNIWNGIVSFLKPILQGIANFFTNIWDGIKTTTTNKFNEIKTFLSNVWNSIKSNIQSVLNSAKTIVSDAWNKIKTTTSNVFNSVKETVGNIFNSIKSSMSDKLNSAFTTVSNVLGKIKDKFSSIMDNCKNVVKNAIDKVKSFFNFKWELPKIKLPHFTISGKFSLNPPSVPKFSIDWYKLGGVFDSPHLFNYAGGLGGLGEDGAEAVVPLEKNTQWLDRLATMLNEKQGGGNRPIILQVDGKTFAEIAVDSINDLTRQRGSLPLRLI